MEGVSVKKPQYNSQCLRVKQRHRCEKVVDINQVTRKREMSGRYPSFIFVAFAYRQALGMSETGLFSPIKAARRSLSCPHTHGCLFGPTTPLHAKYLLTVNPEKT